MSRKLLPSFLPSLRLTPNLPPQSWYLIAGVTLSTLNRPDDIPHVFQYAIEQDGGSAESQLAIARRLREALVKAAPIGGLPKVGQESEEHDGFLVKKALSAWLRISSVHQCFVGTQKSDAAISA